jgi:hypothetical protein
MSNEIKLIREKKRKLNAFKFGTNFLEKHQAYLYELNGLKEEIDLYIQTNLNLPKYDSAKIIFIQLNSYLTSYEFKNMSIRSDINKLINKLDDLFYTIGKTQNWNKSIIDKFSIFCTNVLRLNEWFLKYAEYEKEIKEEASPLKKQIKQLRKSLYNKSKKLAISSNERANIWNGFHLFGKKSNRSKYETACQDIVEDYQKEIDLLKQENRNLLGMIQNPKYSPIKHGPKKNFFGFGNKKTRRRIKH